jgi:hypothetical protein
MFNLPSEATVVSNVARKHYGVDCTMYNIDPVLDQGEKQLYDSHTGKWGVNRMRWYIEKGDDLQRDRPIEFDYFRTYDENPSDAELQVEDMLWESDLDVAPRFPREGHIKPNCTLTTDLSVVPKDIFEEKRRWDGDGMVVKWWELHYKLIVTIQSGPMLFSLNCGGKQYTAVAADY